MLFLLFFCFLCVFGENADLADKIVAFNNWANELLPSKENALEAFLTRDMGVGARATRPIQRNAIYSFMPVDAVISSDTVYDSEIGWLFKQLDGPTQQRRDEFHALLIYIVHEKRKGSESKWFPYLDLLPATYDHVPYFFSESVLEQLQSSSVLDMAKDQASRVLQKFNGITRILTSIQKAAHLVPTWPEYKWATGVLNSRRIWWNNAGHLVPMLDFVNCRAGQPVHSTKANRQGTAITKATVPFKKGEQVFENYGQPNHIYFLYHGFSLQANEHDCVRLPPQGDERQPPCVSATQPTAPIERTRTHLESYATSIEEDVQLLNDAATPKEWLTTIQFRLSEKRVLTRAIQAASAATKTATKNMNIKKQPKKVEEMKTEL